MFKEIVSIIALVFLVPTEGYANRIFTSGFELQNLNNAVEWYTSDTTSASGTISTTTVASGTASLRINALSSGTAKGITHRFVSSGSNGIDYILRLKIYIATLPNAVNAIGGFGDNATANIARIRINTNGTIGIQADADTAINGSTVLALNTWYTLELRLKRNVTTPNAGQDELEARINTVSEVSSTTQSISVAPSRITVGGNFIQGSTDTALDAYFDDIALNDSNGTSEISWPSGGSVIHLYPNGAGEYSQTVTLAGSSPAATDWQSLDDGAVTGTVDDTDYVTFTANTSNWTSTGSRIAVALSDMGAANSIPVIQFNLRVHNANTLSSAYVLSAQVVNGTRKADSSNINFAEATQWMTNIIGTVRNSQYTLYTDPSNNAWTTSNVNSLQFLIRGQDTSPAFNVTSAWATVDYDPSAGGPTGSGAGLLLLGVN